MKWDGGDWVAFGAALVMLFCVGLWVAAVMTS